MLLICCLWTSSTPRHTLPTYNWSYDQCVYSLHLAYCDALVAHLVQLMALGSNPIRFMVVFSCEYTHFGLLRQRRQLPSCFLNNDVEFEIL